MKNSGKSLVASMAAIDQRAEVKVSPQDALHSR